MILLRNSMYLGNRLAMFVSITDIVQVEMYLLLSERLIDYKMNLNTLLNNTYEILEKDKK